MTLPALYVLADEYRQVAEQLADMSLPDEVVRDTLECMRGDLEEKATNVAMFARNISVVAKAKVAAADELYKQAEALEKREERLRDYLLANMQRAGIEKIESPYFTLAVRSNPAKVDVFDAKQVPAEYLRQPEPPPLAVDKKAVAAALKAGADVPGCRLTQNQRLEIK
jgi:TolA-binding protein